MAAQRFWYSIAKFLDGVYGPWGARTTGRVAVRPGRVTGRQAIRPGLPARLDLVSPWVARLALSGCLGPHGRPR